MKEFNINVHVQIGITDALFGLLSAFAKSAPAAQVAEQAPAPVEAIPAPPAPVEQTQAEVTTQEPEPAQPAPVEEAQPAAPEPEKEFTEVDVRAAMDRTRRRIEGENYKEDTNGEGYKKWHRVLTGQFKAIAALHGADKPSALPDHASRAAFIAEVDELIIKDGELVTPVPF